PEYDFTLKMPTFEWGHTLSFSRNGALAYHHQIFATVPSWVSLACSRADFSLIGTIACRHRNIDDMFIIT
ncbi:hypothetical protein WFK93_21810, partial [Yersinia enterocolitica]